MDPPRLPLVVEVWPRLGIGSLVKSRPDARRQWLADRRASVGPPSAGPAEASPDAFDAAAAALALAAAGVGGLTPAADPQVALEGWIWGVPMPPAGTAAAAAG